MEYQVIRSSRKTLAIQITEDSRVVVRAPNRLPDSVIRRFVAEKEDWIRSRLAARAQLPQLSPFTHEELQSLAARAAQIIPQRVEFFARLLGVDYGRITLRFPRTRWGSCSAKGNLNFNCLLMLAPPEVLDYVIVHELCHRKELNHSPRFWAEVEKICPDYRVHRQWLKDNGSALIGRLP